MAICPSCRETVDAKARRCPYCTAKITRPVQVITPVVIGGLLTAYCISRTPDTPPVQAAAISDEQWIAQHGEDSKSLDDRFGDKAQSACSGGANSYLKGIANYEFKWDDDASSFLGVKFDKILTDSTGLGMMTLMSTRAELSNGFGAFQHIRFYCLYNAATNQVARYSQLDPAAELAADEATAAQATPSPKSTPISIATPTPEPTPFNPAQTGPVEQDPDETSDANAL